MKKTKIACVGDSITYGFLIFPRKKYAYPSILQKRLGDTFIVKNFGVNGATVTQTGNRPYMEQGAYTDSLSFQPDIVIIMLSTNDTREMNRDTASFKKDYLSLIESYRQLNATIIVMSSPELYCLHKRSQPYYGMNRELLKTYQEITEELVKEHDLLYLNLNKISEHYGECFLIDGVHPNKKFAAVIAQAVSEKINEIDNENRN